MANEGNMDVPEQLIIPMRGGAMSIRLEVWGDNALFTRGEFKTERVTYDVMTPSAARGILEAIFWHPGMCWRIDRIHVTQSYSVRQYSAQ